MSAYWLEPVMSQKCLLIRAPNRKKRVKQKQIANIERLHWIAAKKLQSQIIEMMKVDDI